MNPIKGLWITWEFQRRNYGISSALGFRFYEIDMKGPRFKRYLFSIAKTYTEIATNKPDIVIAQNPSIILSITVILLRKFCNYKVVIDAHNSGIYPREGKSSLLLSIAKWLQRKSDLTLVTNDEIKAVVESNGGRAYVLPDKIPTVPTHKRTTLDGNKNVVLICTFSDDEPYQDVIETASLLKSDICIYLTGKYEGKVNLQKIPRNIKLLGYVSEDDYWALLQAADVVMDLTLREGCLVCGAYEALAVNKPLILSNTKTNKSYFSNVCVYVDPMPESIANGIMYAISNLTQLEEGVTRLKSNLQDEWNGKLTLLQRKLNSICSRSAIF